MRLCLTLAQYFDKRMMENTDTVPVEFVYTVKITEVIKVKHLFIYVNNLV